MIDEEHVMEIRNLNSIQCDSIRSIVWERDPDGFYRALGSWFSYFTDAHEHFGNRVKINDVIRFEDIVWPK